ncbi:MAG: peptidyl-prolyl cis-trans isomerase [Betaproteobacteria bacterium]|nr:peptidyl-prolyl cis-trans isomerase [Betaproteobacteria bacterium]
MLKKISVLAAGLLAAAIAWAAPTVEMTTNLGAITLELFPEKAPKTVEMFLYNAKHGFYEATIFHRVIDGFMIQGGGFNSAMEEKKPRTPALQNEANNGLTNDRGTVAMARTQDPHSAKVQFFINLKDNSFLNYRSPADGRTWGYAVFGKVTHGMDVVDKIAKVPTGSAGYYENVPTSPVIIQNVKIISEK